MRKPNSGLHVAVGTTKKSIDAIPSAWFRRNVFQDCEGGYLAQLGDNLFWFVTLDCHLRSSVS
jgi:hypothetical protein